MLTKSLLRQLANASSYSRGEDYFDNEAVRRIKRMGNTFTGKVEGSELYQVSLTLDKSEPDFSCDCPYDYDGICKHCVAFGLAVIEEFGPVIDLAETTNQAQSQTPAVDTDQLWQETTTEHKLDFLRQLLDKQPDIRSQLAQFVGQERPGIKLVFFSPESGTILPAATISANASITPDNTARIEAISTAVFEQLSELAFDDDGLDLDEDDYYSEETPDPDPLIESVLTDYANQVSVALREGRLTDAVAVYLGVYEGSQAATEPETDDYDCIGDYPTETWAVWNALLADDYRQLGNRVLHPDHITLAMSLLASRVQFFDETDNNPDDDHDTDDNNPEELYYDLSAFEPLLLALATDMPSARAVQTAITKYDWQKLGTEIVQLRIADVLHDPELWLQTADQFADHDPEIGLQLLQRQQQTGHLPTLLKTLHRLTKQFPNTFNDFIIDHLNEKTLTPGEDLNLMLNALESRCRKTGQLPDYLRLREYWSVTQRHRFAESLRPASGSSYWPNPEFYAQILHTENRADDLLAWVKILNWNHTYAMAEVLAVVAQTNPAECMNMAITRCSDLLETGKRDRTLYGTVANSLAVLYAVPSLKSPVVVFAGQLVANYPRLSALRDELSRKGLLGRK